MDQHICYSLQDELFIHYGLTKSVDKQKQRGHQSWTISNLRKSLLLYIIYSTHIKPSITTQTITVNMGVVIKGIFHFIRTSFGVSIQTQNRLSQIPIWLSGSVLTQLLPTFPPVSSCDCSCLFDCFCFAILESTMFWYLVKMMKKYENKTPK